jgi:putative 4-mercaptohistidine N1-methyltranferase
MAQEGNPQRSALDLGCSVGRTTFELATHYNQVTGIDFSTRFIDIARHIKKYGKICYRLHGEGDLVSDHKATLAEFDLEMTTSRVTFSQGDVQCLATNIRDYDLVLAANLIDRLPDPGRFLTEIHQRLVIGGLLVIASPYNWMERFTPKKQWLSCRLCYAGTPRTSLEGLGRKLGKHFTAIGEPQELEFVIRDTARTFHHSISQVTLWRRVC